MEDRIIKYFERARIEGKTERVMINRLIVENPEKVYKMPEYRMARLTGLNIIEAELATLLSQELKTKSPDVLVSLMECEQDLYSTTYFHKKP